MKKIILLILVLLTVSACDRHHPMVNEHIIYEGQIPCYSVGPTFYPTKNIKMELWFHLNETVHGYWQEKGKSQKHYLYGEIYDIKKINGFIEARKQKKSDNNHYWADFKEMSKSNAYYRIRLSEYRDENFSERGTYDPAFYIYNFENGNLQGTYYTPVRTMMTNGKDSWWSDFNVKINLKKKQE